MEANQILKANLLELVFDGRNQEYGAYELRKSYNKRIVKALLITFTIAGVCIVSSVLAARFSSNTESHINAKEVTLTTLPPDEVKAPEPPPVPPKPVEPPKVDMKKFTEFKVVDDKDVNEPPPAQDDLRDSKIAVINQDGIKDEGLSIPESIGEGKDIIETKVVEDENKIFDRVEVEASFVGGTAAWARYLERNLRGEVAAEQGAPAGTYRVVVRFVVSTDGSISDVQPLSNLGYGLEEEAIRVIKKGPKWKPANQNGRSVNAYRTQPVTFQIQGE